MDEKQNEKTLRKATILSPYNIMAGLVLLSIFSCLLTIYIVTSSQSNNLVRSHPLNAEVLNLFVLLQQTIKYTSWASVVILMGTVIYEFIFLRLDKQPQLQFNTNIYNAYTTNSSKKYIYNLGILFLFVLIMLPYLSFLAISPWPIASKGLILSSADKRWMIFLYNYIWFLFLLLLPTINFIFERLFCQKTTQNFEHTDNIYFQQNQTYWKVGLSLLFGIAISFIIYGPPWNLYDLVRPINTHLAESMSSYQAIRTGSIPYTGAASFGYGPGTQLITYYYQILTEGLGVNSLRESYAFLNFITAAVMFFFVLLYFKKKYSIPIIILFVVLSPFSFYEFSNSGVINGLFGWSNASRYLALPIVSLLTVFALSKPLNKNTFLLFELSGIYIGLIWGVLAYISQENGILTVLSVITILSAALTGKMISFRSVLRVFSSIVVGISIIFLPILILYFYNSLGFEFISNYRLMPSYAFKGVTNLYWGIRSYPLYFFLMPLMALFVGISSFLTISPFNMVRKMTTNRLVVLSFALMIILPHLSSVVRTADSQVVNSMIGAPFMLAFLLVTPLTLIKKHNILGASLFILSLLFINIIIPHHRSPELVFNKLLVGRTNSFVKYQEGRKETHLQEHIYSRLPESILNLQECCQRPIGVSGKSLFELSSQIKAVAGGRNIYLDSLPMIRQLGIIIFLADLTPSDIYREMNSRFPTRVDRINYQTNILDNISSIDLLVTADLDRPVAVEYIKENPGLTKLTMSIFNKTYYILSRSGLEQPVEGGPSLSE